MSFSGADSGRVDFPGDAENRFGASTISDEKCAVWEGNVTSVVPMASTAFVPQLVGWIGLLIAALFTLIVAVRNSSLFLVLFVAFGVRTGAALVHFYVMPLPDGLADAVTFEGYAWEWGRDGILAALSHYTGMNSYFYAWLMSLVYAVTDRSLLLLQSLSVAGGVAGVWVTWRLANELWGNRVAGKAAWVMALFPTVVMYGALPMREVWFVLFLGLGFLSIARWAIDGGTHSVVIAITFLFVASFFHGGSFVAVIGFLGVVGVKTMKRLLVSLSIGRIRLLATGAVLGFAVGAAVFVMSGVSIPKVGTAEQMVSGERWMHYFESRVHDEGAYPEWTQPEKPYDLIWAVPLRSIYLLFSPFPWDIRSPVHFIGLVDGLFYLALAILAWRNRRMIFSHPGARAVALVLLPLVLAFGVGTGNFGTAARHRAKFVFALIVLASPMLPRFRVRRAGRERQR